MSVAKSEMEWMASASMAPLRPRIPAMSLPADSRMFTNIPVSVTRYISFGLYVSDRGAEPFGIPGTSGRIVRRFMFLSRLQNRYGGISAG